MKKYNVYYLIDGKYKRYLLLDARNENSAKDIAAKKLAALKEKTGRVYTVLNAEISDCFYI